MKLFSFHFFIRDKISLWLTTNSVSKKLFGQNRSIVFNRAVCRRLISHFDGDSGQQANLATGNLGFGFIHYAFIVNTKPKRILCVGSRKGFIPAICALACAENGTGHVDFVDAGYGQKDKNHWSGIAWWKKINPDKHFSFLGINQTLTTYVMTTQAFAKKIDKHTYDYIYIDGDHSYKGVKSDWQLFWPKLNNGGLMIFHDVTVKYTKNLGAFGVWKFWKELRGKHSVIFPFPEYSGLGIIQKMP